MKVIIALAALLGVAFASIGADCSMWPILRCLDEECCGTATATVLASGVNVANPTPQTICNTRTLTSYVKSVSTGQETKLHPVAGTATYSFLCNATP